MLHTTLEWYDAEQTILIMNVRAETWEWSDTYAAMQDLKQQSESVEHGVYTIIIFHTTPPTPNRDVFRNIKQMTNLHPKNNELTIFVGTNSLFRAIFNTVNKIYLLKNMFDGFHFVASKEQALAIIYKAQGKNTTLTQG